MLEEGIVDPTKVTRSALQNAASASAPSTGFASQAPEAGTQNQFGGSFDPSAGDNADDLPF